MKPILKKQNQVSGTSLRCNLLCYILLEERGLKNKEMVYAAL